MENRTGWRRVTSWLGGKSNPKDVVEATGGTRDPNETAVKRVGLALDVGSSREYTPPDFDLVQITNAYDTESYVRQAIDKYIEMMFKSGWDFVGKNQQAVDYVRQRFALMAEMTQIPTDQLLIEIAEDLVKYSNVVLVKARDKQNILGSTKTPLQIQGLGGEPPVVGYFPLNITTMKLIRDKYGTVKGWQQEVEGSDKPVKYKAQDIIHIYYKREKGKAFATPFLLPVLDDIRALRQAEETILKLIYRNLNPLLHIQVGTEEMPGQKTEIDKTQAEFENMDLEAGFVTSERVKMSAISADKIIDANGYLRYFEQRVFTGLGVSEIMMGRGGTSSRSTGDNMSAEFADRVKAFQKIMAIFVDEFIVKEIMMEGGFDPVLNPDDDVDFIFKEIDMDAKIKTENHAIYQYEHSAITEDEMRALIGRDPITDRSKMFRDLLNSEEAANSADTDNRNTPQNQHSEDPKDKKGQSEYQTTYLISINDRIEELNRSISDQIDDYIQGKDKKGFNELSESIREAEEDIVHLTQHYLGADYVKDHVRYINRTCTDLHEQVVSLLKDMSGEEKSSRVHESFGGIGEIFNMRMSDLAQRAYSTYSEEIIKG